jgi:hypothetical protein
VVTLEELSANGIWEDYWNNKLGERRYEPIIDEARKLRESDKGDYVLVSGLRDATVWKSPDGRFYRYDAQGRLVPWQAS